MLLTQPMEWSTACLLRVTFLLGSVCSVFLSPQELAYKQWVSAPVKHKVGERPSPPGAKPPGTNPLGGNIGPLVKKGAEKKFHTPILKACNKHGVDPALVKALIYAESGYNPQAVSAKGALGLMQLMPNVVDALGIKDAFNPIHNINGGVRYLSELIGYFDGDVYRGLAAYNAGVGRVEQPRPFPRATQDFVERVMGYYDYFQAVSEGVGRRAYS
jgi:soluble lytic murein transglycosylase-like protein